MVKVNVNYEKCDGIDCGECADVCSMEILVIEGNKIAIKCQDECSLCESCTDVCPNGAITLEE
ncbi:4Fe-4S binding protein [Methanobacterium sp.]|uniref:4Fe-4S binding protein n=1 Tax=Methanobacterium sp. TaxID=2164 RepID=UPI003C71D7B7